MIHALDTSPPTMAHLNVSENPTPMVACSRQAKFFAVCAQPFGS